MFASLLATIKGTVAGIGASLIDLTGQSAILLEPETAGVLFTPDGPRLLLPLQATLDAAPDEEGGQASAAALLAGTCWRLLATHKSNPSLYEGMVDIGLELGLEFEALDKMAREFCGLEAMPDAYYAKTLGLPEDEIVLSDEVG